MTLRRRRAERRDRAVILIIVLAIPLLFAVMATPARAYTNPPQTKSIYESTADPNTLYAQGQAAGQAHRPGWIILDFGRPSGNGSTYGTTDYGGHYDSFASIQTAVQYFATGYHSLDTTNQVDIAVGTNDSCGPGNPCGSGRCGVNGFVCSNEPSDFTAFGRSWGYQAYALQVFTQKSPAYTNETGAGADDMEPDWDTEFAQTYNAINGYNAQTTQPMADFGSLDGGANSAWTQARQYEVAYSFHDDLVIGQVYVSSQASDWTALAKWAQQNSKTYSQHGVTTQQPAGYTESLAISALLNDFAACGCGITQTVISAATNIY